MTAGTQTRAKIQSLAQLYQTGYRSPSVDATIAKLVAMARTRLAQDVAGLAERLRVFEERYQLASVDFSRRFQAGELGDDADLFEWSAFYHMWVSARAQLTALGHEATSWDNATHSPGLPHFPRHIHGGEETRPSRADP